ncbi:Alkaline phosphatase synthesis sensor protein PhoR [Massilia sp. Bi118]|nr:Alkaline phosphatase synthesis sensor protein PhoR [Massilia sp. Bi118]
MLVAIIVPVAGLSILGLSMLLRFEREARIHAIEEVARSTSLLIDSEIAIAEASINNIANSQDIASDNFERLHRLLSATRKSPLSWTLIADYEGNGLMNTYVPYGTPLAKKSGSWAAEVYDSRKTRVSGYFVGASSKRGVVSVSVPLPVSAGKKYVVTQIFDPNYFNKVFKRSNLPASWIVGVSGVKGLTIARSRNAERFIGEPVRPELRAASQASYSGVLRHPTREGVEVYDVFVRSELTGWTVAIGVPVAEIESASRLTAWSAAMALLVVLGGAVGIAFLFARRIDKSLGNATLAAHALARGEVTPVTRSQLKEADVLLGELHRTSVALSQESAARMALEHERERLLDSERAARRQAEAQSEAKDTFLSMLSHELRNPLAAISGAIAVIRLPNMAPARLDKAWEVAQRQLRHLTRMVEDLLDVRRVLSGKVTLATERVDIGKLLRFCCDSRSMAETKRHRWDVQTVEAWVLGDRTRLEQVVDNLLVNAIKYTPEGGSITVRNAIEDGMVVLEVLDTGVGIDAEVLPTIFDSLVQGPTTIDRSQGGLGLGLSIAKGLVDMHGGAIAAGSEGLGKGSAFSVRLPLAADSLSS